jgi:hypothetical protein
LYAERHVSTLARYSTTRHAGRHDRPLRAAGTYPLASVCGCVNAVLVCVFVCGCSSVCAADECATENVCTSRSKIMRAVPMHKQVRKPERRRGHIPHACSSARPKGGAGIADGKRPEQRPAPDVLHPQRERAPPKSGHGRLKHAPPSTITCEKASARAPSLSVHCVQPMDHRQRAHHGSHELPCSSFGSRVLAVCRRQAARCQMRERSPSAPLAALGALLRLCASCSVLGRFCIRDGLHGVTSVTGGGDVASWDAPTPWGA